MQDMASISGASKIMEKTKREIARISAGSYALAAIGSIYSE
jgi:hypothetical protein